MNDNDSVFPDKSIEALSSESVGELFIDLSREVYFGLNLRITLLEASPQELNTLRSIVERAQKSRGAGRLEDALPSIQEY